MKNYTLDTFNVAGKKTLNLFAYATKKYNYVMEKFLQNNIKIYIYFVLKILFLFLLMFILRFFIFLYNPEHSSLHRGINFTFIGLLCDITPITIILSIDAFTKIRTNVYLYVYIILLFLYYILNAVLIKQAMLILSYDFLISIYGNIKTYLLLSPLKNTLFLIFLIIASYLILKITPSINKEKLKAHKIVILILTFIFLLCPLYYDKYKLYQGFSRAEWIERPMYENIKIIISDYFKFYNYGKEDNEVIEEQEIQFAEDTKNYFSNIILVAIESLDANYLHSENDSIPKECTQNFDNIKNKHVYFTNYFTTAQPTVFGLHSILTSRISYQKDNKKTPNLFTILHKYGWVSYYLSGIPGYWGHEEKYFVERYKPDHSFFSEYFEKKYKIKINGWGMDSEKLFQEALDIVNANKGNHNFIFISTIDTHPGYGPRPEADDICMKNKNITKSPFLLALCAIDRKVSKFINNVISLEEPTLVIITSDHSATHGENFTKRKSFDPDRIPLIFISNINLNNFFDNQINTNYCSQIDLAPTILKFCSIKQPKSFLGKFILDANKSYSRITDDNILVRDENGIKSIHDYDILN